MDDTITIAPGKWTDHAEFEQKLNTYMSQNGDFVRAKGEGEVVFMAGWSAFAESAETARWVEGKLGIAWPGTEPNASDRLEKIGFKQICDKVGGVVRYSTSSTLVIGVVHKRFNVADRRRSPICATVYGRSRSLTDRPRSPIWAWAAFTAPANP